jgi:cell division protein FtsB
MAVLFLLLAFLILVALAAAGLENTDPSTATLFSRSFDQLSEGQLLVLAAGLGFLVALFLFLAFGASRTRRSRRRELKYRRRDAESRVDELERENASLRQELTGVRDELETTTRGRADAVAERDRAEAGADRVRAAVTDRDRAGLTDDDQVAAYRDRVAADDRDWPAVADRGPDVPADQDRAAYVLEEDRATAPAAADWTGATGTDDPTRPGDRGSAVPPEPVSVTRERLDDRTEVARDEQARAADQHAQAAADEEARRR